MSLIQVKLFSPSLSLPNYCKISVRPPGFGVDGFGVRVTGGGVRTGVEVCTTRVDCGVGATVRAGVGCVVVLGVDSATVVFPVFTFPVLTTS
jgi:hypothetical protein